MTRVVVIGGSGHVGTYLVPRLVEAGFEVVNVSRGTARTLQAARRLAAGRDGDASTARRRRRWAPSGQRSAR